MTVTTVETVTYATLFTGVALGAVVPVIPTGALVSAAAAAAVYSTHPAFAVIVVVVIAAIAALIGDSALFGVCSTRLGTRLLSWLRRRADPARLERSRQRLAANGIGLLVLSRLIPGGRIPVMVAAVMVGLSWRWFLTGDAVAVVAWSVTYAAIGILSGSLFDQVWQGIAVAVTVVIVISAVSMLIKRAQRKVTPA